MKNFHLQYKRNKWVILPSNKLMDSKLNILYSLGLKKKRPKRTFSFSIFCLWDILKAVTQNQASELQKCVQNSTRCSLFISSVSGTIYTIIPGGLFVAPHCQMNTIKTGWLFNWNWNAPPQSGGGIPVINTHLLSCYFIPHKDFWDFCEINNANIVSVNNMENLCCCLHSSHITPNTLLTTIGTLSWTYCESTI